MNKFLPVLAFAMLSFSFLFASKTNPPKRNIHIAGLVVDGQTLTPIADADIFNPENHLLGASDKMVTSAF